MKTFWTEKYEAKNFEKLNFDVQTDIAIIGGGIAGLLSGWEFSKQAKTVTIFEAEKVGFGETSGSSAMVSFAHDLIYQQLIERHGLAVACEYLSLNKAGVESIRNIAQEIGCKIHQCDMVLFATTKKGAKLLLKEHQAYLLMDLQTELTNQTELPFAVKLALKIKNQFCLNPYEFSAKLAEKLAQKGVSIFENTRVEQQPQKNKLKIGEFEVTANSFVLATHFPILNLPGFYFAKMHQSRSHNVVFDGKISDMYESAEPSGFEFRPVENGILCGGAAVRTGKYKHKSYFKKVQQYVLTHFDKNANFRAKFSAQDCMTFDLLPFAGRYSNLFENVYVVCGFNKWGFSNSAAAAKIVADCVEGRTESIFSPSRSYFFNAPLKALKNIASEVTEFVNLPFSFDAKKFQRIKSGMGAVVRHKGKRLGIFRDEKGQIHAILAVCPHMGCGLKWNKDEQTWDCPCHGSRFDIKGNILSSPTIKNAERVK